MGKIKQETIPDGYKMVSFDFIVYERAFRKSYWHNT